MVGLLPRHRCNMIERFGIDCRSTIRLFANDRLRYHFRMMDSRNQLKLVGFEPKPQSQLSKFLVPGTARCIWRHMKLDINKRKGVL